MSRRPVILSVRCKDKQMNATDTAAWWGAVIASFVFIWDIYKWKASGARLHVSAAPNMHYFDSIRGIDDNKTYVFVEASNVGDRNTTVTHLFCVYYASSWDCFFRRKITTQFIVPTPAFAQPLPFLLSSGVRWTGALLQNDELEKMMTSGRFYCGVYHSGSKKPTRVRVSLKDASPIQRLDAEEK